MEEDFEDLFQPRRWTPELLEALKADRLKDEQRDMPQPHPTWVPDPREAAREHIAKRERLIARIEQRLHKHSQSQGPKHRPKP